MHLLTEADAFTPNKVVKFLRSSQRSSADLDLVRYDAVVLGITLDFSKKRKVFKRFSQTS